MTKRITKRSKRLLTFRKKEQIDNWAALGSDSRGCFLCLSMNYPSKVAAVSRIIRIFASKIGTIIKTTEDMTVILSIVALVVIALIGWGIAEAKSKMNYVNNDDEQAVLQRNEEQLRQNGYTELNIKDVIRTIATTGYSAV